MIHLHTLGDTLIKVGEKSIRPTSPLMFAALLYLGMERGRRVPRAALQELLFPKMDERSGAHSLRQLLYKLRQLRAPIEVDAATAHLPPNTVRDDTVIEPGSVLHDRLLAGAFLPGYEPTFSESYREWLDQQRHRVSAQIRRRLVAAIQESREALDWNAVERNAALLDAFDPYNEVGVLARAEAAALSGGKAVALQILRQYEADTGHSQLHLPAALLRRRIDRSVHEATTSLGAIPFKGRDADVRELRYHIARARHGTATMFLIEGEPGIGKSRLVQETAALASLEGFSVYTVHCHSHYTGRPLSVFIDLVPELCAARGGLGISPESLARLHSLTQHTDSHTSSPDPRDSITRSELLLAAVRDLIDAVASEQPLFLCVEDVHWADSESLKELARLVQVTAERRCFVVCTTREIGLLPTHAVTQGHVIVRRLKPLAAEAMTALARHLLPNKILYSQSEAAEWCVQAAAGNPLFLQMLCAHLSSSGEAFSVPPDVVTAVDRRVEQLPRDARRVLELIALLGRQASLGNLQVLWEFGRIDLLDAIQLLEEQGYLEQGDDVLHVHGLLSDSVLRLLPPASKRLLHAYVASTLEKRYEETRDAALLWDCTEHWKLSGEVDKPVQFLRQCARHAISIGGPVDALSLLQTARQLTTRSDVLVEVLGEIMLAAKTSIDWEVANEAAMQFDSLQLTSNLPAHNDFELASIQTCWYGRMDDDAGVARALRCIHASSATDEHRVQGARVLLTIAQERCDTALGNQVYNTVSACITREASFWSGRDLELYYHAVFGQRQRVAELMPATCEELLSVGIEERMRLAFNCATILGFAGLFDDGEQLAGEYADFAQSIGALTWVYNFATLCCVHLVGKEDFVAAERWLDRARALARPTVSLSRRAMPHANQLEIALWKRDRTTAEQAFEQLKALSGRTVRFLAYARGAEARIAQLDPDFLSCDQQIREMLSLHARVRAFGSADSITQGVCEALLRGGRTREALLLLEDYGRVRREGPEFGPQLLSVLRRARLDQASLADFRRSENTRLSGALTGSVATGGKRSRHT